MTVLLCVGVLGLAFLVAMNGTAAQAQWERAADANRAMDDSLTELEGLLAEQGREILALQAAVNGLYRVRDARREVEGDSV
ncbi:hypothetical protein [Corynebacterium argentoratense]|uniref:hypothetical protein n=1 Tax=Corynebacterium argentoratense TaxID=42817 RepID=UPI00248E50F1|nr:hypothetical protein [Corynebacterium argentoratense]